MMPCSSLWLIRAGSFHQLFCDKLALLTVSLNEQTSSKGTIPSALKIRPTSIPHLPQYLQYSSSYGTCRAFSMNVKSGAHALLLGHPQGRYRSTCGSLVSLCPQDTSKPGWDPQFASQPPARSSNMHLVAVCDHSKKGQKTVLWSRFLTVERRRISEVRVSIDRSPHKRPWSPLLASRFLLAVELQLVKVGVFGRKLRPPAVNLPLESFIPRSLTACCPPVPSELLTFSASTRYFAPSASR